MFKLTKRDPETLLKEATAKRKAGDLEGAINVLREAYKEISKSPLIYTVDPFLRLPMYLQEAKRNDEAWGEFNLLLTKGYPNQPKDPQLIPMMHSIIYGKMRLFLQREGKSDLAVRFGIFSYISWAIGLYRQKREEELKAYIANEAIQTAVGKLLKKIKKENLTKEIGAIVIEQMSRLPNPDFEELAKKINEKLLKKE